MNVIAIIDTNDFIQVIKNSISEIGILHCTIVKCRNQNIQLDISAEYYDVDKVKSNIFDLGNSPSIDRAILESLYECETVCLRMFVRFGIDNYEDAKSLYLKHVCFWNNVIEKNNINMFISDSIPHLGFDYIIYSLCKIKKIPTVMFYRIPTLPQKVTSKYILTDITKPGIEAYRKYLELEKTIEQKDENSLELPAFAVAYIEAHHRKGRPKVFLKEENPAPIKRLSKKQLVIYRARKLFRYLITVNVKQIFKKLKDIKQNKQDNKYYANLMRETHERYDSLMIQPNLNCRYIYFALHMQPECTTSPMAGVFVEQQMIVHMLSCSVPNDVKIYIKEHPRKDVIRHIDFYNQISKMKNVYLVDKAFSSFELMEHSIAVATATGTVGWEALLRGIPVIMFGYYFYQYAPGVFHINSMDDLKTAIHEIIENKFVPDIFKIKLFFKALEGIVIEGYANERYKTVSNITAEENINRTTQALVRKIREMTKVQEM